MLKALELVGFKSFADKTRFDFPPGITAVVGPNGSGKSNVVDAIKWVLGEQSVKSLRGKEMADVIFNGAAGRLPLNFAETTLTLDNASRRLPIDTAEVLVTRRVYRSGEGEYFLNRQPCRLKDIRDLFSGTGVASEAYSVIEQGKVDALLQSSPRERRLIFEEAAGISRFKAKKIESLRRLERVDQNLLRLGDIVAEVEHRLRQIRLQAGKARRYQEYTGRLEQLRTHVGLADWRVLGEQLAALEGKLRNFSHERQSALTDADGAEAAALEEETLINDTAEAIRASESRSAQNRERIATREAGMALQRARSAELEVETARLRRQLAAVSVRAGGLQQQLDETSAQLAAAEAQHVQVVSVAEATAAQLAADQKSQDLLRRQAETSRQAHLAELRRVAGWESERSALTAQRNSAQARQTELAQSLAELESANRDAQQEIAEITADATRVSESLSQQKTAETSARERSAALTARQRAVEVELAQSGQRLAAARERAAVLEELERRREGFSDAVKDVLEQARGGADGPFAEVRGVVAEMLQASVEMAPLVEAALGERAQHVVVTSIDGLLAAMAKSPYHFDGQVTFTPLDARGPRGARATEPDLHGLPGVTARADELVQTSPQLTPLARRMLGHVWIVDSLPRASELARQHASATFVTLAGEVVSAEGTASFGRCQPATGLISRRSELREIQSQVAKLEADIAEAAATSEQLTAEGVHAQQEVTDCAAAAQCSAAEQADLRSRAAAAQQRAVRLNQQLARVELEAAAVAAAAKKAEEALTQVAERLQGAAARVAELERDAARQAEHASRLEQQRGAAEIAAVAAQVERAKSEERLDNLRLRARGLEQDQRERFSAVDGVRNELAQCQDRYKHSERAILQAESEVAELYLQKERCAEETEALVIRQDRQRSVRGALLADAQRVRAEVRELEDRIHAEELAAHEVRHARDALAERLREDYGIDLAALSASPAADEARERAEIDGEITELRRKIQQIGNVNLEALEELAEVEKR
ncbi:MAG TPA: chromosome segregation protein SMC, partial [Pirellulales bacterium]